ncbi:MAG: hypothetical protein ACTSQI_09080 [Candidatus Helarchaeota archaeon]
MVIFKTSHLVKAWGESSIITLVTVLGKYKYRGAELLKANGIDNMKLDESFELRKYFKLLQTHSLNLRIIY